MRAVVCRHEQLSVEERPEAPLGPGQVRLEVLRCGICGSDLHARTGMDAWADMAAKVGYDRMARQGDGVVFGHEFSGRVAEFGPKTKRDVATGATVVAVPLVRTRPDHVDAIGLSPHAPGAYAEQVVVQEPLMMAVPNGLPGDVAALT
jgi:threonine dehydrogenase-like Zn-dependent dehydrogenase